MSAQRVSVELKTSVASRVKFTETKQEYNPYSDCSFGDEILSGELNQGRGCIVELSGEPGYIGTAQDDFTWESMPGRPRDRILRGELKRMKNKSEGDWVGSIGSRDGSKSRSWGNLSESTFLIHFY